MLLLHPASHSCCDRASLCFPAEAPLGESTMLSAAAGACTHEARWSCDAAGPGAGGAAGVTEAGGVL